MVEADNPCEGCGAAFVVKPYRRAKARFCSQRCAGAAHAEKYFNKGPKPWAAANLHGHRHKSASRFSVGHEPWNKGKKGLHLAPATEFQKGRDNERKLPLGSVTIRTDKTGKPRAWVKTSAGWMPRAQVVYRKRYGEVPEGCVVHHRDGDTLNDRPSNLVALTRPDHIAEHREELRRARHA